MLGRSRLSVVSGAVAFMVKGVCLLGMYICFSSYTYPKKVKIISFNKNNLERLSSSSEVVVVCKNLRERVGLRANSGRFIVAWGSCGKFWAGFIPRPSLQRFILLTESLAREIIFFTSWAVSCKNYTKKTGRNFFSLQRTPPKVGREDS